MLSEQKSKRSKLLALLGAAHSLNHSLFVIAPPLLTIIMDDLQVSKFVIGMVGTASSFIYGAGSLIGGPIGDRIGEVKTITLCLVFAGLSSFLMLLADNIIVYALSLILIAIWASLYHPAANSLVSKVFHENTGEAMGIHGMGGTLGVMLTPTVAWFIGKFFGWEFAFIFFGVLSIMLALILRDSVKDSFNNQHFRKVEFFKILMIPQLWRILIFNISIGLFMKGIEYFFPLYLKENKQMDPMWASVVYTLVLAFGVPGQWIGGKTSDMFGSRKVLIATSAGVLFGLLSLQFLPFHFLAITMFLILYGISFYGHQPALNSLTGAVSPERMRGTAYGVFFFTSFGIGSISQSLAGFLADTYGLGAAFQLLTIFALVALALSFFLPKAGIKEDEK
jgi:predicted MFS family arabinose efflux permease